MNAFMLNISINFFTQYCNTIYYCYIFALQLHDTKIFLTYHSKMGRKHCFVVNLNILPSGYILLQNPPH